MADRRRTAAAPRRQRGKRKERKNIPRGRAYIQATFNNTIVTLTDPQGNVIAWTARGRPISRGRVKARPTPRR